MSNGNSLNNICTLRFYSPVSHIEPKLCSYCRRNNRNRFRSIISAVWILWRVLFPCVLYIVVADFPWLDTEIQIVLLYRLVYSLFGIRKPKTHYANTAVSGNEIREHAIITNNHQSAHNQVSVYLHDNIPKYIILMISIILTLLPSWGRVVSVNRCWGSRESSNVIRRRDLSLMRSTRSLPSMVSIPAIPNMASVCVSDVPSACLVTSIRKASFVIMTKLKFAPQLVPYLLPSSNSASKMGRWSS